MQESERYFAAAKRFFKLSRPFIWGLLFMGGVFAGFCFWREFLSLMLTLFEIGLGAGKTLKTTGAASFATAGFLFLKNLFVASLCIFLGRPTRGVFPVLVCILNGVIIGVVGGVLAYTGTAPWRFCVALAPHGALEIPAIFLSCAIGIRSKDIGERLANLKVPAALLLAAAAVETWVSPAVVNALL